MDSLLPVDLHVVFETVLTVLLPGLRQEERLERQLYRIAIRDLNDGQTVDNLSTCGRREPPRS